MIIRITLGLFLLSSGLVFAGETLIPAGAAWRYSDQGQAPAKDWTAPAFDDGSWKQAKAPLGYGDKWIRGTIGFGKDKRNKHPAAYFRRSFELSGEAIKAAHLRLMCDDGAVVYLNGRELLRENMPAGTIRFDTLAVKAEKSGGERAWRELPVPAQFFTEGRNVVAVEVHQVNRSSSDLSMDLALSAVRRIELERGPYVQRGMQTAMTVVWRTTLPTQPVLRYGTDPDKLDRQVAGDAIGRHTSPFIQKPTVQYEAGLTGLSPSTTYYYEVLDGEQTLAGGADCHFTTAPPADPGRALRFWAVGDSGTGQGPQKEVFQGARKFFASEDMAPDLYLHVGDMAYGDGTDEQFQAKFFEIYAPLLKNTVCWPAMGNHEGHTSNGKTGVGPYYDAYVLPRLGEAGGVPSGTESWYSFDYGPVHFVVLNSYDVERSPKGDMYQWLEKDLAQAKAQWLVAYWHHPPYTFGSHDSNRERQLVEMRVHVMPLLEKHGVDLTLSGHSHIYERSMLINGAYETPTRARGVILDDGSGDPKGEGAYRKSPGLAPNQGSINIVTGGGGAGMRRGGTVPLMREIRVEYSSVLIEVEGDQMQGWMINRGGEVLDHWAIEKSAPVVPAVVAHPWHPDGPKIEPHAETFKKSVKVTLSPRPAAPDAVIRYTLDGSEPGEDSSVYTKPIAIEKSTTVKAFSTWNGGKKTSPVAERKFERK